MPFDNLTWGRVDAGKEFDSASILSESQFKDGEVVPMEACTLFIDSVEDLVNNVKGVKDAAVDFGRFVADINPFTALLPDSWKDDAASYLKEKGDAKIDATVQGTKDTFVERKPCAMLGNLGEGVLTNAFMSEKQREDHLKASGVCQTDQEKADRLSGKQGIDPLGLVT